MPKRSTYVPLHVKIPLPADFDDDPDAEVVVAEGAGDGIRILYRQQEPGQEPSTVGFDLTGEQAIAFVGAIVRVMARMPPAPLPHPHPVS